MNNRLRLPLALALALGSSQALALGLGQIEVKSGLNEPLAAEIPVVATPAESADLQVRLASPDAFARVGLDRPATLAANLEFNISKDARGRTTIKVSTPDDVVEPFITFLLEVDWGRGKMLREYTVLLDSPTMAPIQGAPAATSGIADSEPSQPEALPPPSLPEPVPPREAAPVAAPRPEPTPAPAPIEDTPIAEAPVEDTPPAPSAPSYASDSYTVASGETLWSIASRTRPDSGVSVNQMMLALLRANPDAFIGNNINRLRSGAVLRIPGRDDATAMAAAEAAAQVRDQTQTWRETTRTAPQPAAADSYTGLVENSTRSTPAAPDSRLELTPPANDAGTASATQSGASTSGEGRELRADLARTREEVGTLTQENVELKSRVGELEKIQSDSARLIELKDSELAAAQRRLAELEQQSAAAAAAAPTTLPPDDTLATPPADTATPLDSAADTAVVAPATDDPALDTATTDASDPAAADGTLADGAAPADGVTPPMGFEPDTADTAATTEPAAPATAPVTEPAPAVAEPLPARPEPTPWYLRPLYLVGAGLVLVGLIALVATRRRRAAEPTAPRYDSEALAASVAAAQASGAPLPSVGDADEREGDLIEAISRDPSDLQRHLELVRHYYDIGDATGFENAAEAMYSRVYDPEDDAWQEVVALGQEIAPEHPLFVATGSPFEVEDTLPPAAPAPVQSDEREIAWDLPPADSGTTQPLVLDDLPPRNDDFGNDLPADSYAPDTYVADLGEGDDAGSDAAATKLELARAYLDMGDVEGARGMLEEVLNEGNTAQRNDARKLLDEIR